MMTPDQHMEHMQMMEQKMKEIIALVDSGDAAALEKVKQLASEALGEEQKEKQMEKPSFEKQFASAYKKQGEIKPEVKEGM